MGWRHRLPRVFELRERSEGDLPQSEAPLVEERHPLVVLLKLVVSEGPRTIEPQAALLVEAAGPVVVGEATVVEEQVILRREGPPAARKRGSPVPAERSRWWLLSCPGGNARPAGGC